MTHLDGKFARAALVNRIGCVGIAFAEEHKDMLYDRRKVTTNVGMCKAGSKLYNAQCARAAGIVETPPPVPPRPHRRPRRGSRAAAAAAPAEDPGAADPPLRGGA